MADAPDPGIVVAGLVVIGLLAAGPSWASTPELGDGTANVPIVAPPELGDTTGSEPLELMTTAGRFGTEATYLRIPDLAVDASNVEGSPRLVYSLQVPALDVDRVESRLIPGPGRLRVPMDDHAYPPPDYHADVPGLPDPGTYEGRVTVRVQSFSTDRVVVNRTVEVTVQP